MENTQITQRCTIYYIDGGTTVVTQEFMCVDDAMEFVKELRSRITEGNESIRDIAFQDCKGRWLRLS